ncbi:MAG: hypothetical protein JMDDDDMK_04503 [Acidobacteria bacterium]|nr:hypothetical protein [Acidobacteriota bacterium]
MHTSHTRNFTRARVLLLLCVILGLAGLAFALTPLQSFAAARQALAARWKASPAAEKILSMAPASVRKALKSEATVTNNASVATVTPAAMFAGISVIANPPSGSAVAPGQVITYDITVNNGFCIDAGASIGANVPANTTFVSASVVNQPVINWLVVIQPSVGGTGAVLWAPNSIIGTFGANESVTVRMVVQVSPTATNGTTISFGAAYQALTGQDTVLGCAGLVGDVQGTSAGHTVSVQFDAAIRKTATPDAVTAGSQINYTLTIVNTGRDPIPANAITVSDPAPPAADASVVGGSLTASSNFSGCTLANLAAGTCTNSAALPPGAMGTITYRVTVAPGNTNPFLNNTATLALSGDLNSTNNSSTVSTAIGPNADLTITKTSLTSTLVFGAVRAGGAVTIGPGLPLGNGEIRYNLAYTNNGQSTAANVTIIDDIPADTVIDLPSISTAGTGGGSAPNCSVLTLGIFKQLNCTVASLAPGQGGTIQFDVSVPAAVPLATQISNQARITSPTLDSAGGNNFSNVTQNSVITSSDLSIDKTTSNANPIAGGGVFAYDLVVTMNGDSSDAKDVVITDALPQNVNFVSATQTAGVGAFSCTGPPVGTNGVVTCTTGNFPRQVPGPTTATIRIVAQVDADTVAGALINTATVTSATSDPNTGNNSDSVGQNIVNNAGLSITKTGPATPVCAGNNITYNIAVIKTGNSSAINVTVTDVMPANTSFVSVVGSQDFAGKCSFNPATQKVTCSAPFLRTTSNILLTIKTSPNTPPGNLTNSATLVAGTGAITGTNPATATTTIQRCTDLSLDKSAPSTGIAGGVIDYTLKLTNNGPSTVIGGASGGTAIIMDTLPAGVTPLTFNATNLVITPPGSFTCSYDALNNKVTCQNTASAAGDIQVGGMVTIIFKARINANFPQGTNANNCAMASVAGTGVVDPNPGNNSDCASTVVNGSADLVVSKRATPVVDPDDSGPLPAVPLPVVGPNVPPGSVNAGGYIRYEVPFGNNGPSDALNVMLNDVIPGNTAFVGAINANGNFVPGAQPPAVPFNFNIEAQDTDGVGTPGPNIRLSCRVIGAAGNQQLYCRPDNNTGLSPSIADGTLPAGYSGEVRFFVRVNESVAGGTIVANPATISSGLCANTGPGAPFPPVACPGTGSSTPDPNPSNNTTLPVQTVVIASSNLSITKIVQSAVTAVSNPYQDGPISPATAPNGTATTGTAVLPGTYLTYRITLTNNGPSDVSNIRLTDVLPSGLESPPGRVLGAKYVSANPVVPSGATFTCSPPSGVNPANNPQLNGGQVVCTAPLLSANAPNNTAAIDITVFIDPATKASLVDTATFDATINNFNRPISGQAVLTTPVAPTSDLALTKTHAPDPVIAGTSFDYTITLTNNGPSAAQMVNVVDTLPAFQKVTAIQIQQSPDQNGAPNFSCAATPAVGSPGNTTSVTCTAAELPPNKKPDGTVNPAGTVKFILTVTQDALTPQPTPTTYQNCVTATSMSTDPVPANNTNICDTVNVIFRADLSGTKVDTPDPVIAGKLLTYTITANNAGPSAALNLKINDPLPTGTVFISASASPGATLSTPAVNSNGTVMATWDAAGGTPIGLTGPGVTRTLTIVVRVCADFQQILGLSDAQMCTPNLTDTATISSATTDPNPGNNTASATTTVQAQSDLSISKSAPSQAVYSTTNSPSNITYTINFSNAGPSNSSGTVIVDVLPKGFTVVGNPVSTVPGTTFNISTTNGVTTVTANLGVLGAANQCGAPRPTSGVITIVARVPIKHPTITVTNTATISTTNCLPDPNLENNTATASTFIKPPPFNQGDPYPALSEASDQKEGSILFYPIYTSDAANGNSQNTRISMTNTSPTERVTVHLFAVDGASCAILDAFVCLTPNQTVSFMASDFDPGSSGYLVAVAVEDDTGLPRAFNELIGDEYVKFSSGHHANLNAESVAATMMFPAGTDPNVTSATLKFDGMSYNRLPRILAADNIPSAVDGNSTMLIINRVGGNFTLSGALIGGITGLLFNDEETSFSFTANQSSCQYRTILSNTFPRTFTPFNRVIDAGHTGWMKFWGVDDSRGSEKALFGSIINFNSAANANANAYNQGHNLHKMTLTDKAEIVVPVFIPSC